MGRASHSLILVQNSDKRVAIDCRRFLAMRGIADVVIFECGVRFDYMRKAVVFPLMCGDEEIYLLRERKVVDKDIWTVSQKVVNAMSTGLGEFKFPRLKNCGAWFGYNLIDWTKPVVLVEGEIDAMRMKTLGVRNVMASTTSSVTDAQIDSIHASLIYLGYDADKAGLFAHKRIIDRLAGVTPYKVLDWALVPSIKDSAVAAKDAGDVISAADLAVVLKNAR